MKQLLVIHETFVLVERGTGFLVVDYERVDETDAFARSLARFINGQVQKLRDEKLPVAERQFNGGLACENMRALGQPRRAWPIIKEMLDLGTDNVSDSNLQMFQGVLKELVQLETPPEEYRTIVDKMMALKPRGNN